MTLLDALWLGLIQALTEFLPVSSSGHLRLAHALFGAESGDDLLFDLLLHVGTLAAVVAIYREDLVRYLRDALSGLAALPGGVRKALDAHEGLRMALLVGLATLPTGVIGLLLKGPVESDAFGPGAVCGLLVVNGAVLQFSRPRPAAAGQETKPGGTLSVAGIGPAQALLIGVAQGIAVLPGISRSGLTIVTALMLGAERMRAAQFSFLLALPAIAGAVVLKLGDGPLTLHGQWQPYAVGTLTAGAGGAVALWLLLRLLRAAQFHYFSWYCWLLGSVGIVAVWVG